jgi:hypothetical protein
MIFLAVGFGDVVIDDKIFKMACDLSAYHRIGLDEVLNEAIENYVRSRDYMLWLNSQTPTGSPSGL